MWKTIYILFSLIVRIHDGTHKPTFTPSFLDITSVFYIFVMQNHIKEIV
jgi:hypothetical protein